MWKAKHLATASLSQENSALVLDALDKTIGGPCAYVDIGVQAKLETLGFSEEPRVKLSFEREIDQDINVAVEAEVAADYRAEKNIAAAMLAGISGERWLELFHTRSDCGHLRRLSLRQR